MKELPMQVINSRSAGIDVGSRFHMVAVDQNQENVKRFGVYSPDHTLLIKWLKECAIESIAMESTGNYWQTLFDALQGAGFEVHLVNGNQIKNVKGKKTDVLDCLWIQKLHSLGLLKGSFLPDSEIQGLRTYYNHRNHLIAQCSKYINKMQKALRLMNLRLDVVLNDIMGLSGRTIIEAILQGERDAVKLASLANYRVKKSRDEIAKALEGNWRDDLLFELESCLNLHDIYCQKIKECDLEMEVKLKKILPSQDSSEFKQAKINKQRNKYTPGFDIERFSWQYYGVNLMEIQGVGKNTLLSLLVQIGDRFDRFPSSKDFCSWLRLAPNNKVTGGKTISSRTPKGKNQFAIALRQAANAIGNQKQGPLLNFFKRIAYRKDRASAITATARKLATIIYNMITRKEAYKPTVPLTMSDKTKNKIIKNMQAKIQALELTPEQLKMLFTDYSLSTT
jgi:transposase